MDNPYGVFDLDTFGTVYQGAGSTTTTTQQQQQQQQQQYNNVPNSNNGPSMNNYDPSVFLGIAAAPAPYNNSTLGLSGNTNNSINNTHQAMMPSGIPAGGTIAVARSQLQQPGGGVGVHINNTTGAHHDASLGLVDFDPIPISKNAASQQVVNQHHHHHHHQHINVAAAAAVNVHHHHHHHLTQQQKNAQRQQYRQQSKIRSSSGRAAAVPSSSLSSNNIFAEMALSSSTTTTKKKKPKLKVEPWMDKIEMNVSGISLEPLNGMQIITKLQERTDEVITRYLPCVDFLVQCQQELRKGLAAATTKRFVSHMFRDAMTPRQFYTTYISNLPERFYRKNRTLMGAENLNAAVKELQKLCASAKAVESQGCEAVKNTFLGGMKDGESWGLRRWLSKEGGALYICNDTECLLSSCKKLDQSSDATIKLASRLRPLAKAALSKLKNDVPSSYQEQSTAHPYLPFFHRLEACLRGMSDFDPEDDDIIIIDDDDEVEDLKKKKPPPKKTKSTSSTTSSSSKKKSSNGTLKRKASAMSNSSSAAKKEDKQAVATGAGGGAFKADDDSVIELLELSSPQKKRARQDPAADADSTSFLTAVAGDDSDYMKALLRTFDDDVDVEINFDEIDGASNIEQEILGGGVEKKKKAKKDGFELAAGLEQVALLFDTNNPHQIRPDYVVVDPFWDDSSRYATVLRLFATLLRSNDTTSVVLDPMNDDEATATGNPSYKSIIKHPLCFRDIVFALLEDFDTEKNTVTGNSGLLSASELSSWNMWNGKELLQAIDLVLLNALAYGKATGGSNKSNARSRVNKLRKSLWAGIKAEIDLNFAASDTESRRQHTPTRRGEASGFVVQKG